VLKGFAFDFFPNRVVFHISPVEAAPGAQAVEVSVSELKAVFFVKDFVGNAKYDDVKAFNSAQVIGRKMTVRFSDGETLAGTTQGYDRQRPGFFLIPADPQSNIERCYVVVAATTEVSNA
jgi:hypothetical protein